MTAQEMVELRAVLTKADEKCKLLDEIKKVEYMALYVTVSIGSRNPISNDLAKRIFETGCKALREATESELEQLRLSSTPKSKSLLDHWTPEELEAAGWRKVDDIPQDKRIL